MILFFHSYAPPVNSAEQALTQTQKKPTIDAIAPAALDGKDEILKAALSNGFDPNQQDSSGRSLIMFAAYNGHTKTVDILITAGANINAKDFSGSTPLMWAASGPFTETVALLLQNGAEINAVDYEEQFTALMWAAAEGQTEVVKLLLKNKADFTLKDKDGDTAESFASQNGHTAVVNILRSAAAHTH